MADDASSPGFGGTPEQVLALLGRLHPIASPEVEAVHERLHAWQVAVAAEWAGERTRLARTVTESRLDGLVDGFQRMCIGASRMGPDEADAVATLRLGLMPDGVGQALNQPWPVKLRWARSIVEALNGPYRDAVEHLRLRRAVDRLQTLVDRWLEGPDALTGGQPTPDADAVRRAWSGVVDGLMAAVVAHLTCGEPGAALDALGPRRVAGARRVDEPAQLDALARVADALSAPSGPSETRSETRAER